MNSPLTRRIAAWFTFSREERWWVAAVLALFLAGLLARWWHLAHRAPEPYRPPPGVEETTDE